MCQPGNTTQNLGPPLWEVFVLHHFLFPQADPPINKFLKWIWIRMGSHVCLSVAGYRYTKFVTEYENF